MITLLKVEYGGVFHLDEENRNIQKVDVTSVYVMEMNFPGSTKEGFNYHKLESIMYYYMKFNNHQTLTDAINQIIDNGFFYPLRPGLGIEVERI